MTIYPPTIPQYHKYRISSFFRYIVPFFVPCGCGDGVAGARVLSSYTFEGSARGRKAQMGCTPPYVAPQKLPSHWNEGKISPVVEHAKA